MSVLLIGRRAGDEQQVDPVELEALFDNIRSVRNVGSMFRSADGAGIGHLHLCGFTPTPDHPQLRKTSLDAEASVPWTQSPDAVATADRLRSRGHVLWAVEGGPRSECLYAHDTLARLPASGTLVLVFGHEVSGVDPRVIDRCAHIVRLPMHGIKGSLNVGTAFGIAAYHLTFASRPPTTKPLNTAAIFSENLQK
ncbi:MAG: TrmH family RNA methyltransferase [Nannocystaceae bacterium]